jgi:peroxiredoxin
MTHPGPASVLGPGRCKRFAMHVVDGVIKAVNVSEGPDDPVRSLMRLDKQLLVSHHERFAYQP